MDVEIRVGEGLKIFGGMKMMFIVRSVSLGMKKELYKRMVKSTVTYEVETWGLKMEEICKLNFIETKCLRSMCTLARMNRWRNEEVKRELVRET